MKPLVIYHANCTDGFGAAFAAWLRLGGVVEYLPMEYGRSVGANLPMFEGREVYILDFSFPKQDMDDIFAEAKRVVWLDHHKTAFEMWDVGPWCKEETFWDERPDFKHHIRLDNNKSGALLAWEYFLPDTEVPMLIQHIDDYDRWQFKLDGTKEVHAALNSHKPWSFEQWWSFLAGENFLQEGEAILRAHNQHVQSVLKQARSCILDVSIDGYRTHPVGLAANAPSFLASDLGHELANKSGTFGLVWSMAGDGQVHCSLRSNGEYDVSAIAKAFGGGGHRNAAGFSTDIETLMEWLK